MANPNSRYWTEQGRREYQRSYRQEAKLRAVCVICNQPFNQDIYDRGQTCSRSCTGVLAGRTRKDRVCATQKETS